MTVPNSNNRIRYAGNGVQTIFTYNFRITQASDLLVVKTDLFGVDTTLVRNVDYTLEGAGEDEGGTVTLMIAPVATDYLTLLRQVAFTQETDYLAGDNFPAEAHEAALDKLTMGLQQLDERIDRSLVMPVGSALSDLQLPLPGPLPLTPYYLRWNAAHTALEATAGELSPVAINPQWYGAKGDGIVDDTGALNEARDACPAGGVIYLPPGTYKTTGWLIDKSISLVSDVTFLYGTNPGATLLAAGDQDYVLKFQGVYGDGSGNTFLHPYLRGINVNGANHVMGDSGFILDTCHLSRLDGIGVMNCLGYGMRLQNIWEFRIRNYYIYNCGVLDTGAAVLIAGPNPLDYSKNCSNVSFREGTWSCNRGRWLDISSLAAMDVFWFMENKLELDDLTILNGVDTDVLHIGALSRGWLCHNSFSSFGTSLGRYTNLIWIGGGNDDGRAGAPGNSGILVRGNRYYGQTGSGAINGLSLGANAPTVTEEDNEAISNAVVPVACPNVNVSVFPQLINQSWRNFSTNRYQVAPRPDRELPGFLSMHKLLRNGTMSFAADGNALNNARTVLEADTVNQVAAGIVTSLDLSRYVGHTATNLVIRLRMRLKARPAAETATVTVNPCATDWHNVDLTVNSADWAWYSATCPIVNITQANHMLDIYLWALDAAAQAVLVDGLEFDLS